MKTKYLIFAAAALALVACNKQETKLQTPETTVQEIPVGFDAYTTRGVTKAGYAGELNTAALQAQGFGVFAYYTDNIEYDAQSLPNFMYNQEVTYAGSAWTYSPIKYWPNEYGSTAISDDVDKVSFFAYTPYVAVTPATGKVADPSFGITGMTRNSANGDPILKYVSSFDPAKSVDLCWGVVGDTEATTWNIQQTGAAQSGLTAGFPWIDVQRPADPTAGQKLKFTFKHALSKLNVQIDADPDITDHATTPAVDNKTKVYVRSITFTGFAIKGALNLNNKEPNVANKAYWLDYAGVNELVTGEEVTIFDGRKDGKEGVVGAIASNEKTTGLNPVIISGDAATAGVTSDPVNLFGKSGATPITLVEPVYVIPTGDAISVNIVYDVETEDANLPTVLSDGKTYGSSIENSIRKNITPIAKFENGKAYTLKLHLGLNSVKFDAAVTDWVDVTAEDAYLPAN